jgi:hypothetical protein
VEGGCGRVNDLEISQALLQPVPSLGPSPSPLDRHPQVSLPTQQPQELRPSLFAALVRAGELARSAEAEAMDKKSSV